MIGGAAGLLTGLAAAYLVIRNREESEGAGPITPKDGLKVGVGLVSLLKQIAEIGKIPFCASDR